MVAGLLFGLGAFFGVFYILTEEFQKAITNAFVLGLNADRFAQENYNLQKEQFITKEKAQGDKS